jgi:acetyl esterase/lipase
VVSTDRARGYNVTAGITYATAYDFETKLDEYQPNANDTSKPTLMFFHGGGWVAKETWALWFLPLQLGWVVVNVEYRPSSVALSPAAVQDDLSALCWIARNAGQYTIDTQQLVIAGLSAGGHLALTTGMMPPSTPGIAEPCLTPELLRVSANCLRPAAIINWCGITDDVDICQGPNSQEFAVTRLGHRPDRLAIAKSVSPLTYVRADLPPIITLHGDKDQLVPHSHAVRLHDALSQTAATHQLITLSGPVQASLDAYPNAYPQILDFLTRVGVAVHLT